MRQIGEIQLVSVISYKVKKLPKVQIEERLGVEALAKMIMNLIMIAWKSMGHWWRHLIEVMFDLNQEVGVRYETSRLSTRKTIYKEVSKSRT